MFPFSVYLDGAPEVNPACVRLILVCGPLRFCIPLVPNWLRPRFLYHLYCILTAGFITMVPFSHTLHA